MKSSRSFLLFLVLALVAFAAGLGAAVATLETLPPLSSAERAELVDYLHRMAKADRWWEEYYAITDADHRDHAGFQRGVEFAAYYAEHGIPTDQKGR